MKIGNSELSVALGIGLLFGLALALSACNDTKDTVGRGAKGASGVAGKMKNGTLGEDGGESATKDSGD